MENKKIFLKPTNSNLIVRDPITKAAVPPEGEYKLLLGPYAKYWKRRIKDGSLVVAQPKVEEKPAVVKKTKKQYGVKND